MCHDPYMANHALESLYLNVMFPSSHPQLRPVSLELSQDAMGSGVTAKSEEVI